MRSASPLLSGAAATMIDVGGDVAIIVTASRNAGEAFVVGAIGFRCGAHCQVVAAGPVQGEEVRRVAHSRSSTRYLNDATIN